MKDSFLLVPSQEKENWWVLTDKENGVVVRWEDGKYNETQITTDIYDNPPEDYVRLAGVMKDIGDWLVRYHSSKCFPQPFGYEFDENECLYLYRRKNPKWRLEIKDNTDPKQLADSLRKAAEFITKR